MVIIFVRIQTKNVKKICHLIYSQDLLGIPNRDQNQQLVLSENKYFIDIDIGKNY